MPTLVALQPPPALPPILGPPPPYPRRTNRTPSLNPPAILLVHTQAIHPQQAPLGDAVSPIVDGDDGSSSSVVGVAVGGGTDLLSGSYHDSGCDGFSEVINDDDDYSGFSEDDDKKEASNPNCLDYSTDEDDEDNYIFDPDLEEFELVDLSDPNKGSKKIRGRPRGNIGGPQPPDYSTMNPVDKKMAEDEFIRERRRWCSQQRRSRMTNLSAGVTDFTGVLTETLRTMQDVQKGTPLLVGQSFPSRDIIMLRTAEEANLRGIHVVVHKSDKHTFKADGYQFYVNASSSRVPGVTRHNIMPYWWMRSHWRRQIPQDLLEANIITIGSVKSGTQPDRYLRYCPDWTANNKSGRPKKDARKKSVLEGATGKKGEKRASGVKRARRYCQSCGMFNHVTNDCWNLPSNAHKRPAYFAMRSEVEANVLEDELEANVLDDESATEEWGIAD